MKYWVFIQTLMPRQKIFGGHANVFSERAIHLRFPLESELPQGPISANLAFLSPPPAGQG